MCIENRKVAAGDGAARDAQIDIDLSRRHVTNLSGGS